MFQMVSYSKDGKYIAACNRGSGTVKIYNATNLNQIQNLVIGMTNVNCVDFSSDSLKMIIAGTDSSIQIWSISSWSIIQTITTNSTYSF